MRKFMLMMLLAVASSNAIAEWIQVGQKEDITVYADPSTIRGTGNTVKMWKLVDFQKTPVQDFTKPFRSFKVETEFDCREGTSRRVAHVFYSDNMGEGEAVLAEDINENWVRHNLNDTLWKMACERK